MITKSEFHFLLFLFAGMCIGQAVFADGYTEPRIDPEPGHSGKPLLLRCENDLSRTFEFEHQRAATCKDHETHKDPEPEKVCRNREKC